jgi:2-oxoglutarate ferredoxin oxidoreductase subunit gamma
MEKDQNIIISGFGGQGTLLLGKLIAAAGMVNKCEVSWIPSYGPEMRGGTANCTVRVSKKPIGSPVVGQPNCLIAMNLPSLDKFEGSVEKDGILIYNTSLINREPARKDIKTIAVPATELAADKLKSAKFANMILFGTYLKHSGFVSKEIALQALEETVSKKHADLLATNKEAIEIGMQY